MRTAVTYSLSGQLIWNLANLSQHDLGPWSVVGVLVSSSLSRQWPNSLCHLTSRPSALWLRHPPEGDLATPPLPQGCLAVPGDIFSGCSLEDGGDTLAP